MLELSSPQNTVLLIISVTLVIAKIVAVVDCVSRPAASFLAIDTLPKRSWLIILTLALLAHLLWWGPLDILNLIGTVAALVYLAQVKGSDNR